MQNSEAKKIELLSPVGNLTQLKYAINSGADAVYLGLKSFNARLRAPNFDFTQLKEAVEFSHLRGVKVYLTLNTLIKDDEIEELQAVLGEAVQLGVDAIIATDLAVIKYATKLGLCVHISTQGGAGNSGAVNFYKQYNAKRVILARECKYRDIERISASTDLELEVFVHGAMCTCVSGQCLLSSFQCGKSGNRGLCLQPCRSKYTAELNGRQLAVGNLLSMSDNCCISSLQKLKDAGAVSFKIEGRLRRDSYVSAVTAEYRKALDGKPFDQKKLLIAFNRGAFIEGHNGDEKKLLNYSSENHQGIPITTVLRTKLCNGYNYGVVSGKKLNVGDGIRIVRQGEDMGGLNVHSIKEDKLGQFIPLPKKAKEGDEVYLTDSQSLIAEPIPDSKLFLGVTVKRGESVKISCNVKGFNYSFDSGIIPQEAKSAPLTESTLKDVFLKTDTLPFNPIIKYIVLDNDLFMAKGALNAVRREFYQGFKDAFLQELQPKFNEVKIEFPKMLKRKLGQRIVATNCPNVDNDADFIVYNGDIDALPPYIEAFKAANKTLYIALGFMLQSDYEYVEALLSQYATGGIGIYADSVAAVYLARNYKLPYIAGFGLNIFNQIAYSEYNDAELVCLSCELSQSEAMPFLKAGGVYFGQGIFKLMTFAYCPLKRLNNSSCERCKYREGITYLDDKEVYHLRRRRIKGCYFELSVNTSLYNELSELSYNVYNNTSDTISKVGEARSIQKGVE